MNSKSKSLIVIVGPTAVGKTDLAIRLGEHFRTEIVSADARQFYQEMNIGTAKPSAEELKKVKHYLVNSLSIKDEYDVSQFEKDALFNIERIFTQHDKALLVGGSGLFIDAVCNGLDLLPQSDAILRNELQNTLAEKGIDALQQQLKVLDPEYHSQVDLKNPHRLIRAIEVCLLSGKKYSSYRTKQKSIRSFNIIKIGINASRDQLYERINMRVDKMITDGLIEEVKSLLPSQHLNALNTVGYKELFEYLKGEISLESAVDNIKQNTRNYAKRQLTWFKRDTDIKWFEANQINEITEYIVNFS